MKEELGLDEVARMTRDAAAGQGETFIADSAALAVECVGFSEAQDEQIRDTLRLHREFLGVRS